MGRVVVVDYGIGNVFSVCNALKAAGCDPLLTRNPKEIREADRLILPGVGAFARARQALDHFNLPVFLKEFTETGRPFLGICVGMQLLLDESTEFGITSGLGYIAGQVQRIADRDPAGNRLRVPHISWANLRKPHTNPEKDWEKTVLNGIRDNSQAVYFVHSFHAQCTDPDNVLAEAVYGGNPVTAAIQKDNIIGFQFHPERSGQIGQEILKRFLSL